ncbi:MAG: autotransporter outer membrane beta-barrel domain-containing protein [Legionella sp.]
MIGRIHFFSPSFLINRYKLAKLIQYSLLTSLSCFSLIAKGADAITWTNANQDNQWAIANNWSSDRLPTKDLTAIFGEPSSSQTALVELSKGQVGEAKGLQFNSTALAYVFDNKGQLIIGEDGIQTADSSPPLRINNAAAGTITLSGPSEVRGTVAIVNNGTLRFQPNSASYVNNNAELSGVGVLNQDGSGTTVLQGQSYGFGGRVSVEQGALIITGLLNNTESITINEKGMLEVNSVDDNLFFKIKGDGTLKLSGAGQNILSGKNAFNGNIIVNSNLTLSDGLGDYGSLQASGNIEINEHGKLEISASGKSFISGAITGGGELIQSGSGVTQLANIQDIGQITIINGKVEIISPSNAAFSEQDVKVKNIIIEKKEGIPGTFAMSTSVPMIINGGVSGSGNFEIDGSAETTLKGHNEFTGTIVINKGGLRVEGDGLINDVGEIILNQGTFEIANDVDNRIVNGIHRTIAEQPQTTLKLSGSGNTVLNSHATVTSTVISSGTLLIGNSPSYHTTELESNLSIERGGHLEGYGRVIGDVHNSGVISPGYSGDDQAAAIGQLTIAGNFTQEDSGRYIAQVNAIGDSDHIHVTKHATLGGTIEINAIDGFKTDANYILFTVDGGIDGQFKNVEDHVFDQKYLKGTINYSGQHPSHLENQSINLFANPTATNTLALSIGFNQQAFMNAVATPNQLAIANYILASSGSGAVGGLVASFSSDEQFRAGMNQLSAPSYANQTTQLALSGRWIDEQFRFLLSNGIGRCSKSPLFLSQTTSSVACSADDKHFWLAGLGASNVLGNLNTVSLDTNVSGIAIGAELPINRQNSIGMALADHYFKSKASHGDFAQQNGSLTQLGFYNRYKSGAWTLGGSVGLGESHHVASARKIARLSHSVAVSGHYKAILYSGQFLASYDYLNLRTIHAQSFAGLVSQRLNRHQFKETGTSAFELQLNASHYQSIRSQLGLMVDFPNQSMIKPYGALSWEHEFSDKNSHFDAKMISLGAANTFHIMGTNLSREQMVLQTGIVFNPCSTATITIGYDGHYAHTWREHGGKLQLSYIIE